jgi:hypothetical protein
MKTLLTRSTTVGDQTVKLFSADGERWFSDKEEARRCEERRQAILRDFSRKLKNGSNLQVHRRGKRWAN